MAVNFAVGETFSTYAELEAKIDAYQKENFVQLTRRDTRTLTAARKRVPRRVEGANCALVYYTVHFACVFGSKKYKKGQRLKQR